VRRKGEEQYHPNGGINNVESLAGREIASYFSNLNAGVDEFSPTDTYDTERRAIGALMVEQAYTRYVTRVAPYLGTEGMQPIVDDFSLEIGGRCNSGAVVLEPG
jgi:hypothetical protein